MNEFSWPDHSCIAALVCDAASYHGVRMPDPKDLSRGLDIRVPNGQSNEFGLKIADEAHPAGISIANLVERFPSLAQRWDIPLEVAFIPFNEIPWADYEGEFERLTRTGEYVGAGLDWFSLHNQPRSSLHVVRVVDYRSQIVVVDDPTHYPRAEQEYGVHEFERAVNVAHSGFVTIKKVD